MKTRVYYQVFSDNLLWDDVADSTFPTLAEAQEFISGYVSRLRPDATQENIDYWTAYANDLIITKVIELTEQV